jgi:hypothetical protein
MSWNLKNAKIQQTHTLISKTFHVTTIVFAELTDSKTAAELANAKFPETMQAPVSGPGIYMRIQKLEKALEELKSMATAGLETVEVKPEEVPKEGTWEISSQPAGNKQTVWRFKTDASKGKGTYTFSGPKPPSKNSDGNWTTEDGGKITLERPKPTKSESDPEAGIHTMAAPLTDSEIDAIAAKVLQDKNKAGEGPITGEADDEDAYGSIMKIGAKAPKKVEASVVQKGDVKKGADLKSFSKDPESVVNYHDSGNKKESKSYTATQEAAKGKDFEATSTTPQGQEYNTSQAGNSKGKENEIESQALKAKDFNVTQTKSGKLELSGKDTNSVLAQSSARALQDSVKNSDAPVVPVGDINKATVFAVRSDRFKGYLVVVSSDGEKPNEEVLEKLKSKLPEYLNQSGEVLSSFEFVSCEIESVPFHQWSAEDAEFSATAGHEGHQWAISYFADEKPLPEIGNQEGSEMVTVGVLDVLPEAALPVDIYIYLPVNNKHFLYVRKGKKLGKNQRDRLEKQLVNNFFVKDEDVPAFKKFCIENKLKFRVLDFASKGQKAS